jgi:hypothetical protein
MYSSPDLILIVSVPLKNAFQMMNFSSRLSVSQSVVARQTNVISTACFCARWCSDLACRYSSVWVDFIYTERPSDPSGLLLSRTSKKGKLPFCSTSIVNLMFGWMLFRWCRKPSRSSPSPPSSTEVKKQYELYFLSPQAPSWRVKDSFTLLTNVVTYINGKEKDIWSEFYSPEWMGRREKRYTNWKLIPAHNYVG